MAADFVFKIIIVGEAGVGKSCLLRRYADQTFTENYINTIGVDFKVRTLEMNGRLIKLNIWDSAGQERFRTIVNTYYRGAHGICLVYDITDLDSFQKLNEWLQDVTELAEPNAKKIIIGTKKDLEQRRQVKSEQVKSYSETIGVPYIETSSKEGHNVEGAFRYITGLLLEEHESLFPSSGDTNNIYLDGNATPVNADQNRKKKKCC